MDLEFQIQAASIQETQPEHLTPREICLINAYRKAHAQAKVHPDHLVLGSDTLVCSGSKIYGKPESLDAAHRILTELQGHTHEVITGVCLVQWRVRRQRLFAESTFVTFRPLDTLAIRKYLALINPLDKAGGYAIQEHGDLLVERVSGSVSNVIGLPLERLAEEFLNFEF